MGSVFLEKNKFCLERKGKKQSNKTTLKAIGTMNESTTHGNYCSVPNCALFVPSTLHATKYRAQESILQYVHGHHGGNILLLDEVFEFSQLALGTLKIICTLIQIRVESGTFTP